MVKSNPRSCLGPLKLLDKLTQSLNKKNHMALPPNSVEQTYPFNRCSFSIFASFSTMAFSFYCSSAIPPQHHANVTFGSKNPLQNVKNLVKSLGIPSKPCSPHLSLQQGNWVKLICGASFEDVVDIRNLSLVYTLAGVDCIDCAADPSVVSAVNEGIEAAREIVSIRRPWVMISVNDDEDLHFRKAGICISPFRFPQDLMIVPLNYEICLCFYAMSFNDLLHPNSSISSKHLEKRSYESILVLNTYSYLTLSHPSPRNIALIEALNEEVTSGSTDFTFSMNEYDFLAFSLGLILVLFILEFDPENCPSDCPRPCENVCPANAISFEREKSTMEALSSTKQTAKLKGGVITERCYGCGRCFPICPYDKIREVTYVRDAVATAELLKTNDVDAIEIHTSGRQTHLFKELWDDLSDSVKYLKLVAVSLPDTGDATISAMNQMYSIMEPHLSCFNLWQLDGRPMSGDIGRGATRESIAFAVHVTASRERPPGFLQLAGGTNVHTVDGLKKRGLFQTHITSGAEPNHLHSLIGGIAYGGYARKIVGRVLSSMRSQHGDIGIEHHAEHLLNALKEALHLVGSVKSYNYPFGTQQ
ncbi:hypothetical protein V6N13_085457 [Hibiscus sabdariffa]